MGFSMFSFDSASLAAYSQLFLALSLIPISHYLLLLLLFSVVFLYNFLELHFVGDFFTGFRGCRISLTYHPSSYLYHGVVSKCRILHGRYLTTPWLASPHIQTVFLNFFGNPPVFTYRRQLFHASDGGTIALDWVMCSDVSGASSHRNETISKDDSTPIVVVIPGLTSDSASPYIKHLAFGTAKHGYDVVVSNHRGLGGVSVTSDCFYNAGWTEDTRVVINYLRKEYPRAPLFAIGTSIGANILVKYLGEDGENVPIAGAVAICSPWDLLIGDRFICRRLVQKFYDRALAIGLQGYAKMHEPRYSRLANWEGIKKSRSIRDFDSHATCLVGKFETVDTYYRRCSSSTYVGNVSVPLLCISALDDPVCTREAIPWDECRANKNVVLATSQHGGHLAFFEGITGSSLWWVRATNEFLRVLLSSPHMHVQKSGKLGSSWSLGSSIDQGPFVNVSGDGLVAAVSDDHVREKAKEDEARVEEKVGHDKSEAASVSEAEQEPQKGETKPPEQETQRGEAKPSEQPQQKGEEHHFTVGATRTGEKDLSDATAPLRRCLNQLSRQSRRSVWLLVYVAVMTSWPLVGSALRYFRRGKHRNV